MKRMVIASGVLVFLFMLASCAQPNKQLYYGTWIGQHGFIKKSIHSPDGTIENYFSLTDTSPAEKAKAQIVKCWLDSDGNTWFQTEATILEGPNKNSVPKVQTLERMNKAGSFVEVMINGVVEFNPNSFPTKIDPTNHLYMSFSRAEK
jgi:hypothetical protein